MSTPLAEGLLCMFDRLLVRLRPDVDRAVDWLRDTATPPANLEFRASDGGLYTGLIVLERSKAMLVFAIRSGQARPLPAPSPASAYQPARYEPQPRARDLFEDDDPGDGWNPNDPFLPRR